MNNKNIIFNHTLEQYNKKYRNRRHRLLKYTKKQVEDFDKQYGHYIFNNKTYNLEFDHYLLKDRKWWFTKEDECYHEIPRPIRFAWFRNLNTGVQIATCVLLAGGVIAGSTVGIIEYKKYDATLIVSDNNDCTIYDSYDDANGNKHFKVGISEKIDDSKKGKVDLADISVKKGEKELEKFKDYTFNSATGEVIIKKESYDKYYGKTIITPVIKTIKHTDNQQTWMDAYKPYNDKFQGIGTNVELKRYEETDFKVLGNFYDKDGVLHTADLGYKPVEYTTDAGGADPKIRTCKLMFEDKNNLNDSYAQEIGGGTFAHSQITTKFTNLISGGCTIDYIIGEDYVKYNAYKENNVLYRSATINSNGYITNTYGIGKTTSQLIIEYNSEPKRDNYVSMGSRNIGFTGSNATYTTNIMKPIKLEKDIKHQFFFKTRTLSGKNISLKSISIASSGGALTNICDITCVKKNNDDLKISIDYTIDGNSIKFSNGGILEPDILVEVVLVPKTTIDAMVYGTGTVQQQLVNLY